MAFDLMRQLNGSAGRKEAEEQLLALNTETAGASLTLTPAQVRALLDTCAAETENADRVEFGGGITERLIRAFLDSPYLTQENYEQTLHELTGIFYSYKTETGDLLSDTLLLREMRKYFDALGGSTELLDTLALQAITRDLQNGMDPGDLRFAVYGFREGRGFVRTDMEKRFSEDFEEDPDV